MARELKDWREELTRYLIDGGVEGRKQSDILIRLRGLITAEPIQQELEALLAANKVQKFIVPTAGRTAIVWRATTLLLT